MSASLSFHNVAWLLTLLGLREGRLSLPSWTPRSSGARPVSQPRRPATNSSATAATTIATSQPKIFMSAPAVVPGSINHEPAGAGRG